jgi:hypothetical protein
MHVYMSLRTLRAHGVRGPHRCRRPDPLAAAALGTQRGHGTLADPARAARPLVRRWAKDVVEALCMHPGALQVHLNLSAHPDSLHLPPFPRVLLEYASRLRERSQAIRSKLRGKARARALPC